MFKKKKKKPVQGLAWGNSLLLLLLFQRKTGKSNPVDLHTLLTWLTSRLVIGAPCHGRRCELVQGLHHRSARQLHCQPSTVQSTVFMDIWGMAGAGESKEK